MAYRVTVLPSAESDLGQLDPEVRRRILRRMVWLGENASQIIHHPLANLPGELHGLCRLRVGDDRILYWADHVQEILKTYRVQHRSEVVNLSERTSKSTPVSIKNPSAEIETCPFLNPSFERFTTSQKSIGTSEQRIACLTHGRRRV